MISEFNPRTPKTSFGGLEQEAPCAHFHDLVEIQGECLFTFIQWITGSCQWKVACLNFNWFIGSRSAHGHEKKKNRNKKAEEQEYEQKEGIEKLCKRWNTKPQNDAVNLRVLLASPKKATMKGCGLFCLHLLSVCESFLPPILSF